MSDQERLRTEPFDPSSTHGDAGASSDGPSTNGGGSGQPHRAGGTGLRRPSYSAKMAFIPLVLGVAILIVFSVLAASQHPATTRATRTTSPAVSAGGLSSMPAGSHFHPAGGEPPDNVVAAVRVPAGSQAGPLVDLSRGGGSYDRQVSFTVSAAPAQVLSFFQAQLPADHWKIQSVGPSVSQPGRQLVGQGQQVIGQQTGGDGFYWEIGVTVATPPQAASSPASTTEFSVQLLQMGDIQ